MAYLAHIIIFSIYGYFFNRQKDTWTAHLVWLPMFIILYGALPSLQYNVGTDYFNYVSIYDGNVNHKIFYHKGEFIFYYIYDFIIAQHLGTQSIFILVGLMQSFIFYLILFRLKKQTFSILLVSFLFLVMTGIYQNQMNGLRNYTAVLLFILAFIFRAQNKMFGAISCSIFGIFTHSTFIPMLAVIALPRKFWVYLGEKVLIVYILSFLFWVSPLPILLLEYSIKYLMPHYSHYLVNITQSSGLLNLLTKAYWIPLHLVFLSYCKTFRFSSFDLIILGVWATTAPLFLSLLDSGLFFRLYHYFVFFNFFPAYYLITLSNTYITGLVILYALLPICLKVLVFPQGEYSYMAIGF